MSENEQLCDELFLVYLDEAGATGRSKTLSFTRSTEVLLTFAAKVSPRDIRRRAWRLTEAGQDLHDRILDTALQRQRALLKGFTPTEVDQFSGFPRRCLKNLDDGT